MGNKIENLLSVHGLIFPIDVLDQWEQVLLLFSNPIQLVTVVRFLPI